MGDSHEVLNFNQIFLILNWFIYKQPLFLAIQGHFTHKSESP